MRTAGENVRDFASAGFRGRALTSLRFAWSL
jgi:hypothetical protein